MPLKFFANPDNTVDILAKQGEDWDFTINVTDADDNPFDLTFYDVRGQIKSRYTDETSVADFNCEILDSTAGQIRVYLSPEETSNIPAFFTSVDNMNISSMMEGITGVYVYDIKIKRIDDERALRILEGKLIVDPEVTKY